MKAIAYDPATQTIRCCKLKRTGQQVLMTEAHEDVTEMAVRAVIAMLIDKGPMPIRLNNTDLVLTVAEVKTDGQGSEDTDRKDASAL